MDFSSYFQAGSASRSVGLGLSRRPPSAGQAPLAALRGSLGLYSCPAWQMCLYDVLWSSGLSWLIKRILLLLFSHICCWALGPELIPVYRQSVHKWLSHPPGGRLPLLSTRPAVTSVAFTRWRHMVTRIRFQLTTQNIDPKGWNAELADLWFTHNSGHPSSASRAWDSKSSPARDDILPLCNAANQ